MQQRRLERGIICSGRVIRPLKTRASLAQRRRHIVPRRGFQHVACEYIGNAGGRFMQRVLVVIGGHHVEPPVNADIVAVAGAPVEPVDILRDQVGPPAVAFLGQPAMHLVRRHVAVGREAAVVPQQELARIAGIHPAGGHLLGRVVGRADGPVAVLAAKGGDAAVGANAGAGDVECLSGDVFIVGHGQNLARRGDVYHP